MRALQKTLVLLSLLLSGIRVSAQEHKAPNNAELANKLANPVANLISVPFQNNVDYGIGPYNGARYTLNFQPVIPTQLTPNLNLIARLVLPIIDQHDITGPGEPDPPFLYRLEPTNGLLQKNGASGQRPVETNHKDIFHTTFKP